MSDDDLILQSHKPQRADAIRNRRLLLETAQRLFDEQGVDAVPMSAVAKAAGVGKGTLYRHFNDKGALCLALLDEQMRQFQEETLMRLRNWCDARQKLDWFLNAALDYVLQNRELLQEAAQQPSPPQTLNHPAHVWWRQTLLALLTDINPAGDVAYFADVLYILLDVQTLRFQLDGLGYDRERIQSGLQTTLQRLIDAP